MQTHERETSRVVAIEPSYESWHAAARHLLLASIPPARVSWRERAADQPSLLDVAIDTPSAPVDTGSIRVPRRFVELAQAAAGGSDPERWSVLYEVLWRLVREDRELLGREDEPAVKRVRQMAEEAGQGTTSGASPAIGAKDGAPGAAPFVPETSDLGALNQAAARCQGCDLYRHATQAVFGQGSRESRLVLVGEQPGDQEDRQGLPFVGPAGEVLDRALAEAGIDRTTVYVTNAVKHFKFTERGKRRIHEKPSSAEVAACRPWLEAELRAIEPDVILCLGATAAGSLIGPKFRLLAQHGQHFDSPFARRITATIHPSAVLRGPDEAAKAKLYAMLVDDLRAAAKILEG
jgi:DNA polymerase